MRILILSDLHIEFGAFEIPGGVDFDVAVLAGDICKPGDKSVRWAQASDALRGRPVILVPGNHEFYGCRMDRTLKEMRDLTVGSNVHLLDGDECILNGVRFLGATLWTDFALRIQTAHGLISDKPQASNEVELALNDYRLIKVMDRHARPGTADELVGRRLRARDTLRIHREQRQWLSERLREPFSAKTVVVTHHAPHRKSVVPTYATDWVSAGFVSELPEEFFANPVLWIHGHTHHSFDYRVGNCRVLCNPRGYVNRWSAAIENDQFNPGLVVSV